MGNSSSAPTADALEFLQKIAGPHPLPLNDPAWTSVIAFQPPLAKYDPVEVQAAVGPHGANLGESQKTDDEFKKFTLADRPLFFSQLTFIQPIIHTHSLFFR